MALQSYRDLIAWQKSFELAVAIFNLTKYFPKSELYGLVSQMRRAAFAVPSNIAEGYARQHRAEYIQFLSIAYSSGAELETQLSLAKELSLAPAEKFQKSEELVSETMRLLNGLIRNLKSKKK